MGAPQIILDFRRALAALGARARDIVASRGTLAGALTAPLVTELASWPAGWEAFVYILRSRARDNTMDDIFHKVAQKQWRRAQGKQGAALDWAPLISARWPSGRLSSGAINL